MIEQIRINVRFALYGVHSTQAECIAVLFTAMGAVGMGLLCRTLT
ncbi:hypothetical protein [Massilia phyllosphaerae]|nr:hypothetical protein [Massilia sp. SGZ-792]